jgi:hypothetical protein
VLAPIATAPASAQTAGGFPTMSPDEFVTLLERVQLPGTTGAGPVPAITGNGAADARIVALARGTDYRQRGTATGPLTGASGVALNLEASDALQRMAWFAAMAGAPFVAVSGYRSVDDQRGIFLRELAARGAFSAGDIAAGRADGAIEDVLRLNSIPGFSLHHTGDAVDLVAPGGSLGGFWATAAYRWLSADNYANAKAFGFVPSYPVGASAIGPEPEPWEFTYVGVRQLRCAQDVVTLATRSPGRCPGGSLDSVQASGTAVTVEGWAADRDAPGSPLAVHVYVDGRGAALLRADGFRPDVGSATGLGPSHGFRTVLDLAPGAHQVCAYALNDAAGEESTGLGCRTVEVRTLAPIGALDQVVSFGSGVSVDGWSADPDLPAEVVEVHLYVDGRGVAVLRADGPRPDVGAVTGLGSGHGFSAWVPVSTGTHDVCAYAISPQSAEGSSLLGCRRVVALGSTPTGSLDAAVGDGRSIRVGGWAADGDLPDAPLEVHVYVDGVGVATVADGERPDVASAFGIGTRHGFGVRVPSSPGSRTVCSYAIAAQAGDPNTLLGCRRIDVLGAPPVGSLDAVQGGNGQVSVAGWAADPDQPGRPVEIHLYLDGRGAAILDAGGSRPDVAAGTPYGSDHGFLGAVGAAPGRHELCAWAIALDGGEPNTLLGCRSVDV